ncbi:NACHT, LRR and PYD domains-containing protein 10 [Mesocricetus auratus]|uniref:NACHT, LRR and PYD domains-containing protein 10 n=1 Tax=Mesocricetus auratus TaxID=10036 RepID=A0A1U7QYN1_MESAU|nr:NACHT, LRR and PYD domains-containing protein 10 [Mesocricetus auratus]
MARANNPQEALLWALTDLEENSFKTLKFHLRDVTQFHLARGELEGLSPVDLASKLISMYGALEAVRVVSRSLWAMNLMELVNYLSQVCLHDYREIYREHVRCLEERQDWGINSSCNELLMVTMSSPGSSGSPPCSGLKWEVGQVRVEALFAPEAESYSTSPIVVMQGSAGTGKTTLARKLVQDWAKGTLYPGRFDYVFYVSCREVVLMPKCDLPNLICWCCGDNEAPVTEILRQPERLLFILDGYDELQKSSRAESVLRILIRRREVPCSLLITTRTPALQSLEPMLGERQHVRVLGFSEEERENYFNSYFTDKEQARNVLEFVQSNDILYKACQVPGICWVVCSWLERKMARGQEVSETPSNSTDIFTAYVSTFLPTDGNEDSPDLTRHRVLRGLCSLAAEGIQHQRLLFEEDILRKHSLDGSNLTAFLDSIDYRGGFGIKKLYSFRHISFQEFFYAMSFLVKEDQRQLGEATHREVAKLLEQEKCEEMTLSLQFLFDMLKREGTLSMGLKFYFKIAPSVRQDLKYFKEQIETMKCNRPWDLEFSLYDSKIKKITQGIHIKDITFNIQRSGEKKPGKRMTVLVASSIDKGQVQSPLLKTNPSTKKQQGASNGKSRGTEEPAGKVRNSRMVSTEKGHMEMRAQEGGGVERQEDGEGQRDEKDGEMRDQMNGYQKE